MSKSNTFRNRTKAARLKRKARRYVSDLNNKPTADLLAIIALMKNEIKQLDIKLEKPANERRKKTINTVRESLLQSIVHISNVIRARPVVEEETA